MAQQHSSWTPLQTLDPDSRDVGWDYHPWQETSYYGSSAPPNNYEMNDMNDPHAYHASTSLLQPQRSSHDHGSSKAPSEFAVPFKGPRFSGWKVGVLSCAATAVVVCLLNTVLTIWAVSNHKVINGISFLYSGSCEEVANMSLWIHLAINAMSTLLLSASNYTMQIISSPTRREVDTAHQKFRWLDIGIPSSRNLIGISWGRIFMWSILALSSLPLHLMYNSAVFSSLSANGYKVIIVAESFLTSTPTTSWTKTPSITKLHEKARDGNLTKYSSEECVGLYGTKFVSKVRNVLLVSTDKNTKDPVLSSTSWEPSHQVPYYWTCGDGYTHDPFSPPRDSRVCDLATAKAGAQSWKFKKHPIIYRMVEPVESKCRLTFSLVIMVVVILCNIVKAAVMILTYLKLKEPTLVTIGDAIASFLDKPDPTTAGICLSTKYSINHGKWKTKIPRRWNPRRQFWFKAASTKRWITCNLLCIITISAGASLYAIGVDAEGIYDLKTLYQLGIGKVDPNYLVGVAPKGLVTMVLFANLPQAILSFLYLTYNGIYSCVLSAHEWSLFARSRKPLRVTSPVGQQRSTYYLQLPYTYAIPLLILSGILHWLMSQSLFLAYVDVFDENGKRNKSSSISTVGYSCIAIFFSVVVGSIAVVAGILNGFRRYDAGIPLVGSCSAAISAACHQPKYDHDASVLPVKWGVVDPGLGGPGHCCLTSLEVNPPIAGELYAG